MEHLITKMDKKRHAEANGAREPMWNAECACLLQAGSAEAKKQKTRRWGEGENLIELSGENW